MTADGLEALKRELSEIESKVPDLVKSIELARSDGDLRENAPYHAAREALAFTNDRKQRIETSLKRAVLVDSSGRDEGLAALGSMVTVTHIERDRQETYQLVSSREANARERRISVESPVGQKCSSAGASATKLRSKRPKGPCATAWIVSPKQLRLFPNLLSSKRYSAVHKRTG